MDRKGSVDRGQLRQAPKEGRQAGRHVGRQHALGDLFGLIDVTRHRQDERTVAPPRMILLPDQRIDFGQRLIALPGNTQ